VKRSLVLFLMGLSLAAPVSLYATTFYVDSLHGNDSNAGTTPTTSWKSLQKVNEGHYRQGDHILFRSGSRWEGQLVLSSSGADGVPIIIDRYGDGPLPRIDGNGAVENVVSLENVEEVEVRNLEITNHGAEPGLRRGVLIAVTNFGTAHHLVVADLYIHDVNGTNERKENGGILFRTIGDKVPSRFDGLTIERNIVWKVDAITTRKISAETALFPGQPMAH